MEYQKKYKEINADSFYRPYQTVRKFPKGCQHCGEEHHQICAKCEILLHEENVRDSQLGILSKENPALCTDCVWELSNKTN